MHSLSLQVRNTDPESSQRFLSSHPLWHLTGEPVQEDEVTRQSNTSALCLPSSGIKKDMLKASIKIHTRQFLVKTDRW
jgi:hypothetical protein